MKLSKTSWLGIIGVGALTIILCIFFSSRTASNRESLGLRVSQSDAGPPHAAVTVPPSSASTTLASASTPVISAPDAQMRQRYFASFLTPISFVGKVVDEKGEVVSDATAEWRANDNPEPGGMGTNGSVRSDEQGRFRINAKGIALFVKVSKSGYYSLNNAADGIRASSGEFSNANVLGKTDRPMGTEGVPAVFVLRKRGAGVSLIHVKEHPIKIPKDGTPVDLALDTGRAVAPGNGHLRIECWTESQAKDSRGAYPWRCRISVPGGGLVDRQSEFDFQAPVEGYQASDEMHPDKLKWSPIGERQYFIKTADGHFARVSLRMRTGGDHFVVVDAYFNPVHDSRNLEQSSEDQ